MDAVQLSEQNIILSKYPSKSAALVDFTLLYSIFPPRADTKAAKHKLGRCFWWRSLASLNFGSNLNLGKDYVRKLLDFIERDVLILILILKIRFRLDELILGSYKNSGSWIHVTLAQMLYVLVPRDQLYRLSGATQSTLIYYE